MKISYIFLFSFLVLLACSNPKAKIVERQKQIKDELPIIKSQAQLAAMNVNFQKVDSLAQRQITLQREYDSLEMELKKY